MERRQIANGAFTLLVSGGVAALIGYTALSDASPFHIPLLWGGSVAIITGAVGLIYLWVTAIRTSKFVNVAGDAYTNNGVNNGIMGPVTIGKAAFELTDAIMAEVLSNVRGADRVGVSATGSNSRSMAMADQLIGYLNAHGIVAARSADVGTVAGGDTPITYAPGGGGPFRNYDRVVFINANN